MNSSLAGNQFVGRGHLCVVLLSQSGVESNCIVYYGPYIRCNGKIAEKVKHITGKQHGKRINSSSQKVLLQWLMIVIVLHRRVKAFEVQQVGDSPINPPAVLHPLCFRCFTSIPGWRNSFIRVECEGNLLPEGSEKDGIALCLFLSDPSPIMGDSCQ